LQNEHDISLANIAASVSTQNINAQEQIAAETLAVQKDLGLSTIQAQVTTAGYQNQQVLAAIAAGTQQAQINADVAKASIKAASKKSLLGKIFG
jgi:hypothetical protein